MPDAGERLVKRGPGRPADVDGADTKRQILRSAMELFAQHGYVATTTRMIARDVGVTPAALHHYFGRKGELAIEVWRTITETEFMRLRVAIDEQATFIGKVHALLDAAHAGAMSDMRAAEFITSIREEARRTPELTEISNDARTADLVRLVVEFGTTTGAIRHERAPAIRGSLSAILVGSTILAAASESTARGEGVVEGCKQLFDDAFSGSAVPTTT